MSSRQYFVLLLILWANLPLAKPVGADEIGRLFSTPAERARLDNLRKGIIKHITQEETAEKPIGMLTPLHEPVTFNGVVRSSTGKEIIWINGNHTGKNRGQSGIHIHKKPDDSYGVTVKGYGESAQMKPGQMWIPGTGQVLEGVSTTARLGVSKKENEGFGTADQETMPETDGGA